MITEREEQAYRYRHHDFGGLTTIETAWKMNISPRAVRRLIHNIRIKAPQLFPILTKRQAEIYNFWLEDNDVKRIARLLGIEIKTVESVIRRMKEKLDVYFPPHSRECTVKYDKSLDNQIKEKF